MGRPVGYSPGETRKITTTLGEWSWDSEKIWNKVEKTSSCWIWHGSSGPYGALFGAYKNGKQQMTQVRRLIYAETHNKDVGELAVHHHCGNKMCVNPDHMYETWNQRLGKLNRP